MRCYSERCDYTLEELGNNAWLNGCPLCGAVCWDLNTETKKEIDEELDKLKKEPDELNRK